MDTQQVTHAASEWRPQGKQTQAPQHCDTCPRENQNCKKLYVPGVGDLCLTETQQ